MADGSIKTGDFDEQASLAETMYSSDEEGDVTCDACPFCQDVCINLNCKTCVSKKNKIYGKNTKYFTTCQVRRHNHEQSCWLVAGNTIYDATPYLQRHPGGAESILTKAGGAKDCTDDLEFHSKAGKSTWKNFVVGELRQCSCGNTDKPWWMFWGQ